MFHYVYKLTCPKSGLYYIGLHSTNNLDDGYEGSGLWPSRYVSKHGKNILIKEILSFHDTRELAAEAEQKLVTFNLIESDDKCMNLTPGGQGFSPEQWSKINKGRTKENDAGRRMMAEKLTGRTKETHLGLRIAGEKVSKALSGRTKETHSYIAKIAELFSSRNKENHPGIKAQSEKISGRTKETHPGVRSQSEKMKGRTALTHAGIKLRAEKCRKITTEQDKQLYLHRKNGITLKEAQKLMNLNNVHYQAIVIAAKRGKLALEKEVRLA